MIPKEYFGLHNLSTSDLVSLLQSLPESSYKGRSENSIRSFLSQTMNGQRKLPDELKRSIWEIFKKKDIQKDFIEFSSEMDQIFNSIFSARKKEITSRKKRESENKLPGVVVAEKNDYDLLRKCSSDAKTVTIITAEPAEVKNNILADQLKHDLLEKVRIINSNKQPALYTFYLAKEGGTYKVAFDFWSGIYRYALKLKVENIAAKFLDANKKSLKVFVVPEDEIDVTHGIIDESTPKEISFITVYNQIIHESSEEEINVIREENQNLTRVLRRLEKIRKMQPKELTFSEALEFINRQL